MSEYEEKFDQEEIAEEEVKIPFEVDSDEKAQWCMDRRIEELKEIDKWETHYEAEKRRACMKHQNAIFRLESKLRDYFMNRLDNGLTRKTKTSVAYNLPTGKIFMQQQNPTYERDDETILAWLHKNDPRFIKVKEEVDWSGLKAEYGDALEKVDDETGEIIKIPGVTIVPREDAFKVKDNREEKKNGKH